MIKRIVALIAAALAVATFASCGASGDETNGITDVTASSVEETVKDVTTAPIEETESQTVTEQATTTTGKVPETTAAETEKAETDTLGPLFRQHVVNEVSDGSYTMKFKQLGIRLITTISGRNSVIESDASGIIRITLINKDGRYYMLVPTTKKYVEMTADEYAQQVESFNSVSVSFEGIRLIETGEETVRGITYKTETYDEGERGTVTYYFTDDGLKKLKSLKDGKVNDVETFEITSDVDLSVFDIPDGYIKVDDPGQVMVP